MSVSTYLPSSSSTPTWPHDRVKVFIESVVTTTTQACVNIYTIIGHVEILHRLSGISLATRQGHFPDLRYHHSLKPSSRHTHHHRSLPKTLASPPHQGHYLEHPSHHNQKQHLQLSHP
ncbi:hypothetical protein BC829DRAFT_168311 [Chytridium lagenaria]|nr:hypothetical protein BC829DRAFT_168311 [Chytridium lagenaria]